MFTLTAVPVKFIGLLLLFTFTTAYELLQTGRARKAIPRTSHGLHLAMSVIMLLMVPKSWWVPFRTVVPVPISIAVMALGVLWFAWLAVRAEAGQRSHAVGCALMFSAMVWHLVAMMVKMHNMKAMQMAPMSSSHHTMNHGAPPMNHGAMATGSGSTLWWLAVIGIPLMAWLLWASWRGAAMAVTEPGHRLAGLNAFAMNFGMFWMSTGLLVPILPFFKYLAF